MFLFLLVGAVIASAFSYHVSTTGNSSGNFPKLSLFSTIRQLVDGDHLDGEKNDRINLLLLGIGGEGHEGPQLTDTIIFASYQPSTEKLGLMSLPRDMSVPIPGHGYQKVNHANAFGEVEYQGGGPALAREVIGNVLNQKIQYDVRIDFEGFAKLIDDIGGIDVFVDRTFTDPQYPSHGKENASCGILMDQADATITEESPVPPASTDYSCRFEILAFEEGWTHLDGQTALKFVRSRHGTNGESSDFARSARQQKVLLAVKDKVFSISTILNPSRLSNILDTLKQNISTNMEISEILRFARAVKKMEADQITHQVIDASETSPLYATTLNGAFVLLPKNDDWNPLQKIAEHIFVAPSDQSRFTQVSEKKPAFAKIEIQNGTTVSGLAFRASQLLDGQGFEVTKVDNAVSRDYTHTVIYDLTNGQRASELNALKDFLKADVILSATGWMVSGNVVPKGISVTDLEQKKLSTESDIDFLVILGENASSLVRQ